jgi:hypothetical protein
VVVADSRKSPREGGGDKGSRHVIRRCEKWLIRRELRTSNVRAGLIGSQCDKMDFVMVGHRKRQPGWWE